MKSRVVLTVLAVMGVLALTETAAQAGNGGVPFPLTSFFVCNSINADDAKTVVDIDIPGIGPVRQRVRIGNGVLACAVAKLFRSGTQTEIQPNPTNTFEQLKCYSVTASPRNSGSPPPSYSVTDQFFPAPAPDTGVQDAGIQFICAPAQFLAE